MSNVTTEQIVAVMREMAADSKPNVKDVEEFGKININAKQRDAAWKQYETELEAAAKTDDEVGVGAPFQGAIAPEQGAPTNDTQAAETDFYRVTVKTDGFRRLGRAWAGTETVQLSGDELKALQGDRMFVVEPAE